MSHKNILKHLSRQEIDHQLNHQGLVLSIGPFVFCIQSNESSIAKNVQRIYCDFQVLTHDDLIDFYVTIKRPSGMRRFIRPQINFYCDDHCPFLPLPVSQAFPLLEWGMNWCIVQHAHRYLLLHSAVVEKNGKSIILPAESGSGKSTLCALLAQSGWRLLSDEMALIDNKDFHLQALARPVSLKNESIRVINQFDKHSVMGEVVDDTAKGTISHLKPTTESVRKMKIKGNAFAFVFPLYQKETSLTVEPIGKADAFMRIIKNSFNYSILGETGFNSVDYLVNHTTAYGLTYSDTEDVLAYFEQLVK
ncbi:MAG: HprK-related kinase A [Colwellia sp.]|nr:HprK-related kinase A [Colwellia sp.]